MYDPTEKTSITCGELSAFLAVVVNVRRTNTPEFMQLLRDSLQTMFARLEPESHVVLGVGCERLFVSRPEGYFKESA